MSDERTEAPQPSTDALDAAERAVHACRRYALGHPSRKAIYVEARDEAYDVLMASGYPAEAERLREALKRIASLEPGIDRATARQLARAALAESPPSAITERDA